MPRSLLPSPSPILTRRKALTILAAGVGAALPVPGSTRPDKPDEPAFEWRGRALGAAANIIVRHPDKDLAHHLLRHCVGEVRRLEGIFSLYKESSEICRLNRDSRIESPSLDLRLVLAQAQRFGTLSGGAFDVTIQPIWRLYEAHFANRSPADSGPDRRRLEQVARLVDYRAVDVGKSNVRLARDGMAVSLNGIAQGYFTDRITDLLRNGGMTDVLVDLGEIRATGSDGGGSWRVALGDPWSMASRTADIELRDAAIATSGGYGTRFDDAGRFHHLFDPSTGECPALVLAATAVAPTAMQADALATALAVAPPERARTLLRDFRAGWARLVLAGGNTMELRS